MIEFFGWAARLRDVSPGAKLLALYMANYCGGRASIKVSAVSAGAWCCCPPHNIDALLWELHKKAGVNFTYTSDQSDVLVTLPGGDFE